MQPFALGTSKKPHNFNVGDALEPDVWFDAKVVWELQAADLSKSSVHKGAIGKVDPDRGVGLRFPRFIREREDKSAEGATNAEQIMDMYNNQGEVDQVHNSRAKDEEDDDFLL
jgi:DNA ligase-1